MTCLASLLVNRLAVCCGAACRRTRSRRERIVEAQLVDRRPVLRRQVHQTLDGIRGARAPVRSTARARQRDRFFEPGRREQPLVAHLRDSVPPRGALFGGQDEGVHIVGGHLLPRERRRGCRIRLRRPRLLARHVTLRHRTLFDGPQRFAGDAIEHEEETLAWSTATRRRSSLPL